MNLATKTDPQSLRGRILTHLAGPSESSGDAVMLKSDTSSVTGLAWAFLDETCRLHYNIRLEGGAGAGLQLETAASTLELEDYPIHKADNLKASASKSSIRRFVITEKAPTRAFTFKTLLRHYAKRVLTPRGAIRQYKTLW